MARCLRIIAATVALMIASPDMLSAQPVDQCELSYHTASDATPGSSLGVSVAVVGDLMLAGADREDEAADNAGAAYVYTRTGGVWSETQKLTASDAAPEAHFGASVGTDGTRLVVGASGAAGAAPNTGAAYVFRHDGVNWVEEVRLTAGPGAATGDEFGRRVALDGNRVLVASHLHDGDGLDAGSVYAFLYDGANWIADGRLAPDDPSAGKQFGSSVAIEGDRAVIGAMGDDQAGSGSGAAYVFGRDAGGWRQTDKVVAFDGQPGDGFGRSVAIEAPLVVVSAQEANLSDGAVYVYEHDGLDWQFVQVLRREISIQERFGSAVAIDGGVIAVGEELGDLHFGAGWVYQRVGGVYRATEHLQPSIRVGHDWGGRAIDISGETVVLGAEGQDIVGLGTGAVWMFETSSEDCDGDGAADRCQFNFDCNGNGVFDRCEPDCDGNGVPDSCDIADGSLTDCGGNDIPDVCEPDCNDNGTPDDCDLLAGVDTDCNANAIPDSCDLSAGIVVDCNDNGILDACDIGDGTSFDTDGNCIPDECDPSPTPRAENPIVAKSRFLSFTPVNAGCSTAIRIRFVSLTPHGVGPKFVGSEGDWRWAGPPETVWEDSSRSQLLQVAQLQCDPHFSQWAYVGVLNVYGAGVMPQSTYEVQQFDSACGDVENPACYSDALTIATGVWGDCSAPFAGEPDAGAQPDFRDIAGLVAKFQAIGGPPRVAAELEPSVLDLSVDLDFRDIAASVRSFQGQAYPLDGPTACP